MVVQLSKRNTEFQAEFSTTFYSTIVTANCSIPFFKFSATLFWSLVEHITNQLMSSPEVIEKHLVNKESPEPISEKSHYVSCHAEVSEWHSMLMGLVIVANLALFAGSMATIAADDNLEIGWSDFDFIVGALKAGSIKLMTIYSFSLSSTVSLMWGAGGIWILVALLLVVLSGILPYVRLISLLVVWYYPLASKRREWLLWNIDLAGKMQLINFYLIFLIGSSLGVTRVIGLSQMMEGLPDLTLRIALETKVAMFLFIAATMLSMGLAQHAVSMHYWFSYGAAGSARTGKVFKPKYKGNYLALSIATVLSLAAASLFIWAISTNMFSFTYGGLLGPIMVLENNHTLQYSLISVGTTFPSQAFYPNNAGATFMSVLYIFLCICGPIMLGVAIIFNWYAAVFDLSSMWRRRALRMSQFTTAWSACDIFVIAFGVGTCDMNRLLDHVLLLSAESMVFPAPLVQLLAMVDIHLPANAVPYLNAICGSNAVDLTSTIEAVESFPLIGPFLLEAFKLELPLDQSHCLSVEVQLLAGYWGLIVATLLGLFGAIITSILLAPKTTDINAFESKEFKDFEVDIPEEQVEVDVVEKVGDDFPEPQVEEDVTKVEEVEIVEPQTEEEIVTKV